MALGNPDGASTNPASRTKFLINQREQYTISYNDDTHQANWVSWSYSTNDDGLQARTDYWQKEELLPSGYLQIGTATFGSSIINGATITWDRGHMTPSADRTKDLTNNQVTFRMSNIIPQASSNNRGLWAQFEDYCRTLATNDNEVLITSGPAAFTGDRTANSMSVSGSVWKIAVVVPNATSSTPANQRITNSARVIAILTPNVDSGLGSWQSYITTVEEIEAVTGLNFFTGVDASTAIYLKNVQDTGTGPDNPTVITTFNPTLGSAGASGTSVTISGYNFSASSTVQFNGTAATNVTFVNPNQLTAVVPAGATTGPITVTGPGGTDTSYEDFTVTAGPVTPTISVSPASLTGLTSIEGSPGVAQNYAVNGSNLTAAVTVTAPPNFEVSADGTTFAGSLTLNPAIDGSLGVQVSVRIKSNATAGSVSGNISHASTSATTQSISVSGSVTSSAPNIVLSTTSLAGFAALQGAAGGSKTYTVSGANLNGSITVTAPSGYELSLSGSSFAGSLSLAPTSGTLTNTTIYARLSASAPLGTVAGSITHSGGSATAQSLSVSGTVMTPITGTPVRIAAWDFTGEGNTNASSDPLLITNITSKPDVYDSALDSTNILSRGPGAGYSAAANSFRTAGFKNDGISTTNTDYFEFAFSSAPGAVLSMSSIKTRFAGTASYYTNNSFAGATNQFAYSTNGTNFVLIGNPVVVTNTSSAVIFDVSGVNQLQNLPDNVTVTFRFYASGQTTSGGWGFYSSSAGTYGLDVSGIISGAATPPPVITVSDAATATAFVPFTYQISANNTPTGYAASGLPAGLSINSSTGLISGTPTTPGTYTIGLLASNAAGDGTATLTLNVSANPSAPSITSNLITYGQINTAFSYQIAASNTPTSYTAANLPAGLSINTLTGLISGTPTAGGTFNTIITAVNNFGSDSKTLQIIVRVPTITLTPSTLSAFTANAGFTSTPQSYTLGGSELTGGITVTAPPYFEISTDGSTYRGDITLSPDANGNLSQAIMVRLAGTAPPGIASGAISHTGSGATPKYMEVSGTVSTTQPTLTVSTTSLAAFSSVVGVASSIQTYDVSGAGLTGQITISAPNGFEIGSSEENFGGTIILTPVNGALVSTTIYVRLAVEATAATYTGSIAHSGGSAAVKNVAVTGTVTVPVGPKIIATSGGSAYAGSNTFSYTITTDGAQTVTSYNATGLPVGMSINTNTGVISGTPTNAATYNVTLQASSAQGTSSKPYTLRVIGSGEQPTTPTVVINKYQNATTDRVELLVIGSTNDAAPGPPVDLRGMTIKDFSGSMANDNGGKYVFKNHPLWSSVKAGTLIVLAAGNTQSQDFDGSDFVLSVNLGNATYFTEESGGFDIANTDMIMIKPAGMQPDGVAGGIHALAAGTAGTVYNSFTGRKIRASNALSSNKSFAYVINDSSKLSDFYLSGGADVASALTFGSWNNSKNRTYITNTLRNLDQTPPVVTLNGSATVNLTVGDTYTELNATATGATSGVTITGSVNTSVAGAYELVYSASDAAGNVGTATRTVNVLAPASTPPTVTSSAAASIGATTATLNGNVTSEGTSAVSARGFVYSIVSTTLNIGADGVSALPAATGTGAFSAQASSLAPGTMYYFRAYATNASGTSYGDTFTFTTLKAEPAQYPSSFAAGTVTASNIPAEWSAAEADGYLIVVSSGILPTPVDGTVIANDTDVSDGSGAINLGSAATSYAGFTGFAPGETYTFSIYPFNNSGSAIDYKTGNAPNFTASILTTPGLSVSGTPAALTTTYGTPSSATSFTVSGTYLTSTVSVTAPSGFEVSSNNLSFGTSAVFSPQAGTLAATTVYLRLAATAGVGGTYNAQNITVSGGGAESVTLTTATSGNSVAAKTLTITGLAGADKTYDGTTDAQIVGTASYQGLVNGESFPIAGTVTWTFADKNIGSGKTLTRTGSFTAPSANYTIASQPSLTAGITSKQLTVTGATVVSKTYDGTTTATINGATLSGVANGDTVTVSGSGTFNDANAGDNKPVTSSLALGGTDAGNYTLVQPSLTGSITKASQTITFDALPSKKTGDAPFQLSATASSGLAVSYTSSDPSVASVSSNTVTILSGGTTTITAAQSGSGNYNAAAPVARDLVVTDTPILIAGWDFQTTTNGGTAAVASPSAPTVYTANFGAGTIYLDGSNGSSSWASAELSAFAGATVNATGGLSTVTTSPAALGLLSGTSNAANGKQMIIKLSMADRANLSASYATQRTSTGFASHVWEYSADGTNWTALATVSSGTNAGTITSSFSASGVITLPTIAALNNAPTAYLRLTVNGATSGSGNNRLDNIQINANQLPTPAIFATGTLSALNATYGTNSATTSFSLTGFNMRAGVTVTPPAGFEVSTAESTGYSNSLVVGASGSISATTIYVRLKAGIAAGSYAGNITLASSGAATVDAVVPASTVAAANLPAPEWNGGDIVNSNGVTGFIFNYTGISSNGVSVSYTSSNKPTIAGFYRAVATSADANYTGSATNNFFVSGVVAANDALNKPDGTNSFKIPVGELLGNDRFIDIDGSVLTNGLAVTTATTATGTQPVLLGSPTSFVRFYPQGTNAETFTYTATYGTNSATATVALTQVSTSPLTLAIQVVGQPFYDGDETTVTHWFISRPNSNLQIEYTHDLGQVWKGYAQGGFSNSISTGNGTFSVTVRESADRTNEWRTMFFRATEAPAP